MDKIKEIELMQIDYFETDKDYAFIVRWNDPSRGYKKNVAMFDCWNDKWREVKEDDYIPHNAKRNEIKKMDITMAGLYINIAEINLPDNLNREFFKLLFRSKII